MAPPPPPPPPLDYWRRFFSGARGASIFDAIDAAIRLAAADHPAALRARRDAIAERLYTALLADLPPPPQPGAPTTPAPAPASASASPAAGRALPPHPLLLHHDDSVPSLCSSDGGGATTAPRDDDAVLAEAFRVRDALSDAQDKSEHELLELLGRLQRLEFTVDAIKDTEIGMAVQPLRKHGSKQIRQLVRSLIEGWKATVNEWVNNGGSIVDHTPQSVDASCLDQEEALDASCLDEEEGGLPSPPMDEAALFETPCTSIQLSEFFDEMDDDGNLRSDDMDGGQCYPASQESVKKEPPAGQRYDPEQNWRLDQSSIRQSQPNEPVNCGQTRPQSSTLSKGKPSSAAFGPGRPQMPHTETNGPKIGAKLQQDLLVPQRRAKPTVPNPSSQRDGNSIREKLELAKDAKLEATKRKLQEGYQEFNNAKKQRTIQLVDPQDLPKPGNRNAQLNGKPRNATGSKIRSRFGTHR